MSAEAARPDMDCDVCYPENHTGCKGRPYNGAAPMGGGQAHRRCLQHRADPPS